MRRLPILGGVAPTEGQRLFSALCYNITQRSRPLAAVLTAGGKIPRDARRGFCQTIRD